MTLSTTTSSQELSRPRRGTGALRLVASRLVFLVTALFGVVTLSFLLVSVTPGDPAQVIAGPVASQSQIDAIRADLGLDQPLLTRYGDYIGGLLQGDLGTSYYTNLSVSSEIGNRLPASLTLIVLSVTFAAVIGIGVGSAGAYFRGRWQDRAGRFGTSVFQSVPDFFLGLILIYVVFFVLGLAPAPTGQIGIGEMRPEKITGFITIDALLRGQMATFWSAVSHLVLPVMTLGLVYAAYFAKTSRSTVGKALNSQQAQFARAMGLPERTVLRYSFVEARGTIVTYAGVIFAALIGGEAIVEQVFAWDGLGSWAVQGILRLDIPVVQGMVLVSGAITLITYTVLDIVVGLLDPRITHG